MNNRIKTVPCVSDLLRSFTRDRSGATAIEYALIASGISVVIFASVDSVGAELASIFTTVAGLF